MYYKNASAVCLVYDSTDSASFETLSFWHKELEERGQSNVLINVVASKIDLDEKEEVQLSTADAYAK